MKAIINRGSEFSTLNGVIMKTSEVFGAVYTALKNGSATKTVDNEQTLAYDIREWRELILDVCDVSDAIGAQVYRTRIDTALKFKLITPEQYEGLAWDLSHQCKANAISL